MRGAALAGVLALLVLAVVITVLVADTMPLHAAEATLGPGELLAGGDPRSEGEGPGLVGNPLLILVAVIGLGVVTAGVTLVVARVARRT